MSPLVIYGLALAVGALIVAHVYLFRRLRHVERVLAEDMRHVSTSLEGLLEMCQSLARRVLDLEMCMDGVEEEMEEDDDDQPN